MTKHAKNQAKTPNDDAREDDDALAPPAYVFVSPLAGVPTPPVVPVQTIERTLEEREKTHGDFHDVSHYAQLLKDVFRASKGYMRMNYAQREAVEAWLCKTARLMSGGDVSYPDHAHDVAGYAGLYVRACAAPPLKSTTAWASVVPTPEPTASPAPAPAPVEDGIAQEVARSYAPQELNIGLAEQERGQ